MDANKLLELRNLGYQVRPTCSLCKHSSFGGTWGTCMVNSYSHLKHTDTRRDLSIHKSGWCPKFELHPPYIIELGRYTEFLRGKEV